MTIDELNKYFKVSKEELGLNYKKPERIDKNSIEVLKIILNDRYDYLLDYFIDKKTKCLISEVREVYGRLAFHPLEEQILANICIDLGFNECSTQLSDILYELYDEDYLNFLTALDFIYDKGNKNEH